MKQGWEYKKFETCINKTPKPKQVKQKTIIVVQSILLFHKKTNLFLDIMMTSLMFFTLTLRS